MRFLVGFVSSSNNLYPLGTAAVGIFFPGADTVVCGRETDGRDGALKSEIPGAIIRARVAALAPKNPYGGT